MNISANRQETESWRVGRLEKAATLFCDIFGVSREQARALVRSIHDHKGELQVEWYHAPSSRQREAMELSWSICGEPNVKHSVFPGRLCLDESL